MALPTVFTPGDVFTAANANLLRSNQYNQTTSTKTVSYVLVAADVGTRVLMNAAGSTTITVNTSLFAAGDTLEISNIGAGVCTITSGTCTVTSSAPLALNQYGSGTLFFTSASAAIFIASAATSGVVQVKSTTVTAATFNTSSSSLVDITGLSVSITPTSASNKVLVLATVSGSPSTGTEIVILQLARGGTSIGVGTGGGSVVGTSVGEGRSQDRAYVFPMQFLDSPATTSATTYNVRTRSANGAYSFYLNRRAAADEYNGISTITVMEVTP